MKPMRFLIQTNSIREDQLRLTLDAIGPYPHLFCGVLPFVHEVTANELIVGRDWIPYGSTTMIKVAMERQWRGLCFNPDTFNYAACLRMRDDMLNGPVVSMQEAVTIISAGAADTRWFLRPSDDLKFFSGGVMTAAEYLQWLHVVMACESSQGAVIDSNMPVVLSPACDIESETRWFVVDGRVVSGSTYRVGGRTHRERISDPQVIRQAQRCADNWTPHSHCVMDLAVVGDTIKVIEFNCINGSGFYDHDVPLIFKRMWETYYD